MDRNRADTDRLNIDNGIRISLNLPVVRPYHTRRRKLRIFLSAPFLPPEYEGGEKTLIDLNNVSIHTKGGLL